MRYRALIFMGAMIFVTITIIVATNQDDRDKIIFPHGFHVEDMDLSCDTCHETSDAEVISHDLLPEMDSCLTCHDGETAPVDCETCHTNVNETKTYGWAPNTAINFPHTMHQTVACATCHTNVAAAEAFQEIAKPEMATCRSCHEISITDAGCFTCHITMDGLRPASHGPAWSTIHGLFIHESTGDNCAMCHQQNDCESCHAMAQIEKKVHPVNYEFIHAGDFLGFAQDCSTCHAMPQDCATCHKSKNILPMAHNMPNWAIPGVGGLHMEDAVANPDYCVTCHEPASDNSCTKVGCHVVD